LRKNHQEEPILVVSWQPAPEDLRRVLIEQNPWLDLRRVPDVFAPPTERALARDLWSRVGRDNPRRFQVILGPRRVGKTTVMYQTVKHLLGSGIAADRLWWLRLDHPLLLERNLGELVGIIREAARPSPEDPLFLFLDELVYAKDWDLWLKTFFDERQPVNIVATSSATAALRRRRTESGVGRWEEQFLMPYLFTEFLDLAGIELDIAVGESLAETLTTAIDARIDLSRLERWRKLFVLVGGFPELLLENLADEAPEIDPVSSLLESQRVLRTDAIERAVYKDIPQSFGVDQPMMLERLLYVLAGQMTGILSPTNTCRDLGISQPTFDRYVNYLTSAFIVFALPSYSGSEAGVQRRGRKIYFVDGAVRNAALQRGVTPLSNSSEMGLLLENLVAAQLNTLAMHSQTRLHYWRQGANEVDLIFDHPDKPLAIEVGSSADHARKGLAAFSETHPRFRGRCYLVAPGVQAMHPRQTRSGVGTVPLDLFLIVAGRQAERSLRLRL
jgi:uncharacterized protein